MFNERKALIFTAMEQLLDEEGFDALTYGRISARCFLHVNTIAYYFDSKEDMLVQFFEYIVDRDNSTMPEFYSAIPEDVPPVESFCHLIDHIIDGGLLKSKTRRLLNQLLLPQAESNLKIQKFLNRYQAESSEAELAAIQMYRDTGILNLDNERKAFSTLTLISSGVALIHYFHVKCVDYDYSLAKMREYIKKTFLKEEYYSQITPPLEEEKPESLSSPLDWS